MILLKLAAAPAAVWLASYAGRRWGHRVAGLVGGFPLIAAPIVFFIAQDAAPAFTEELAWTTMAVAPGVAVHCFVYAWLARLGAAWPLCLACAWSSCVGAAWVQSGFLVRGPEGLALALGQGLLLAALMPRARAAATLTPIPHFELIVRMVFALALAALLMFGAQTFGARVSGVLMGFPITASVLPVFTLALHGADATVRLLSGFALGLLGFVVYFFVFATLVTAQGPGLALAGGVIACVGAVSVALRLLRARRGTEP